MWIGKTLEMSLPRGNACVDTRIVIARRHIVPTRQSRKKLVQNALLHGSKKVPYVILVKGGNPGFLCHPEINSGYIKRDAETSSA